MTIAEFFLDLLAAGIVGALLCLTAAFVRDFLTP